MRTPALPRYRRGRGFAVAGWSPGTVPTMTRKPGPIRWVGPLVEWVVLYSAKKNVQILVALLKEHGVRHAVLSPGSRNLALVVSLERDAYFTCHSVVDERSAAYFAIGVALATGEPVLLSSTSGQATRNYIPGMTEAFYRGTPLVVVTGDYKASQIGQGTMQAVDQMSLPSDAAKVSVRLPLVRSQDDESFCARLVNEALLAVRHHGSGPVHIDVPIDGYTWDGGVDALPRPTVIQRHLPGDDMPRLTARKVMVAVGQHGPFSVGEEGALAAFAERTGAVVCTTHLSNYHGPHAARSSVLLERLRAWDFSRHRPDLLVTIGGQMGDYEFDGVMRSIDVEHWRVHPDGAIRDTYGKLTRVFEMTHREFFDTMICQVEPGADAGYFAGWARADVKRHVPALPLSHALVASRLAAKLPPGSALHLAILSALRNWGYIDLDPSIECYSNVAAFGIDGCLSTFIGHASAIDGLCFLVIGDLAFFYDMGALGIRGARPNARIVLVNNGGGGEFRLFSHIAYTFGDDANKHVAAAGHFGSAQGWAESMGWVYAPVRSEDELGRAIDALVSDSKQPVLVEVFTTMRADSDAERLIHDANAFVPKGHSIARHLPPGVKSVAKRALRRS